MARLAYYASQVAPDKPNQFETFEGYRIYKNVPICRTGWQDYLGRELKAHGSYDPAWGVGDDQVVRVYRPLEEVTHPATIASFEGKSVTDEHPPDDVALVHAENENEYGKGHMQNVRVGDALEGETPLLADLWVKHPDLNDKIDAGIRNVSCGYIYQLARRDDGVFEMRTIRGNHIAVLKKGRAGSDYAIRDAMPEKKEKPIVKNLLEHIFGRGLKEYAKDASPEEVAEAGKLFSTRDAAASGVTEIKPATPKEGIDFAVDFYWDAKRQKVVPIRPAVAKDADKEDDEDDDKKKAAADADPDEDDDKDKAAKDGDPDDDKDKAAGDADILDFDGEEQGKTALDAAFLKSIKPLIDKSKDKSVRDAYDKRVEAVNKRRAAADSIYSNFATPVNAGAKAEKQSVSPMQFFNGKSYAEGLKAYNEFLKENK